MGNSQSNEISDEYTKYIEEQKKIIESQQNQINRLTKLTTETTEKKKQQPIKNIKKKMTNTEKIEFILKLFELREGYDETSLKKSYLKLALVHHPDKGGDEANFQKITQAYQFLLKRLSQKDSKKTHIDLKMENSDFMKDQTSDNRYNVNLSDKFDNNVFNKIYEENREKEVYDTGYDKWIKENEFKTDKIERGNINEKNFHNKFQQEKKKNASNEIIPYGEPQVDISFKGKDSLVTLGCEKITDFSGECTSGLKYRDYKDAFSNTHLIDENSIDISKRSRTIKEANVERKNISYSMGVEDEEKQRYIQLMEEKKEKERIRRLEKSDKHAFSTYDAIHQRMLGR